MLGFALMKIAAVTIVVGIALMAAASPIVAHHSIAEYDNTKQVVIKGVVTSVDWRNPHVHIYLDVPDSAHRHVHWSLETWSPGQLAVRGLTNTFIKPGDHVSIDVYSAKDGSAKAVVCSFSLPDGEVLDGPPGDFTGAT
jgi:hypothetical protein